MVVTTFPVPIAKDSPFGPFNIPFGVFSTASKDGIGSKPRAGTAIGDFVLELHLLARHGIFDTCFSDRKRLVDIFLEPVLNSMAAIPSATRREIRSTIIHNLSNSASPLFMDVNLNEKAFVPIGDINMHLPMQITDYTDSFSSLIHAENSLRPLGLPLPSAFTEYPMGYNGRLSSIRPSGTNVQRPCGFFPGDAPNNKPTFQPSRQLDFEIELGAFISQPIPFGDTVNARDAADHIFGYVLHNDWSSRDIQKYEMPPLRPLHSKSFITTISPWIVTVDALEHSKANVPTSNSTSIHPALVADKVDHGVYDIEFTASVARGADPPVDIVNSNYSYSYWSIPQMIAYQSSSGHGINTGDLIASGTISSPPPEQNKGLGTHGCLLEALAIKHELPHVGGKPMSWLEDGDTVKIEGRFKLEDGSRGGFGGVTSLVLPAEYSWQ